MCGIAGEIRFDGQLPDTLAVTRMADCQISRGPDGRGLFSQGNISFGHRRLKIIDLTEHAAQPMFDPLLGLCIVFNGCIYNHHELRDELREKGYPFFSSGDTEVILKAYHAWGKDCVHHFNGMFAFVIWERDTHAVFMARDRLGIKPLYYTQQKQYLRFASTLPGLLKSGEVNTDIDPVALHYYMSFHAVVPAPHTMLQGVRKVPPATRVFIDADGTYQEEVYWAPSYEIAESRSFAEWQELVLEGLCLAVRRRLVADVPVGVLLSGGLDSSLITGLLAEEGQQGLQTFSVGFESVNDEAGDEFKYSDLIAAHYNTSHHQIFITADRLLPALTDCVSAMSEPMVSHDVIGFYLLSQEVAKHAKVVQSGQGADEVFGGYHWYPPLLQSDNAMEDYSRVFLDRDHGEYARAINKTLVSKDYSRAFVAEHFAASGASTAVDKALRIDTTIMLVDDPVKRVDNMTMAWGLEARVPFLDHELVELAARIPAKYKVEQGGKHVLKEAARNVIPAGVIDRPKGYFPVPALKYLRGEYLDLVRKLLDSDTAKQRGIFNQDYIGELFADPQKHITPLRGSKLWQVALLEFWLQQQGV